MANRIEPGPPASNRDFAWNFCEGRRKEAVHEMHGMGRTTADILEVAGIIREEMSADDALEFVLEVIAFQDVQKAPKKVAVFKDREKFDMKSIVMEAHLPLIRSFEAEANEERIHLTQKFKDRADLIITNSVGGTYEKLANELACNDCMAMAYSDTKDIDGYTNWLKDEYKEHFKLPDGK